MGIIMNKEWFKCMCRKILPVFGIIGVFLGLYSVGFYNKLSIKPIEPNPITQEVVPFEFKTKIVYLTQKEFDLHRNINISSWFIVLGVLSYFIIFDREFILKNVKGDKFSDS